MEECAKVFRSQSGIPVKVIGGPEPKWLGQAMQDADMIYGAAEYMLTQFTQSHPGIIDVATRVELYKRRAAILVRPGNPKGIHTLADLTQPGIHILDVNGAGQLGLWEDIAGRENLIDEIQTNITGSFVNTGLAIDSWKNDHNYDAWITYTTWHYNLTDITQTIEFPLALRLYRGTNVALTSKSQHSEIAKQFVQFLKSKQGHIIFQHWGWE